MTRLEDLLQSLTTIIILYHDSQPGPKKIAENKEKSRAFANNLLQKPDEVVNETLHNYILACTTAINYGERAQLLDYIQHEINFLRSIINGDPILNDSDFAEQKEQMHQLLINFRELLTRNKSDNYKTKYSKYGTGETNREIIITLHGLMQRWGLCNSGDLVKGEVFDRFALNNKGVEELRTFTDQLCTEYRDKKLCDYLNKQNAELKEQLDSQLKQIILLRGQLEAQAKLENNPLKEQVNDKDAQIIKLTAQLEAAQLQITEKDKELGDTKRANEVLKERVRDLEDRTEVKLPVNFAAFRGNLFGGHGTRSNFPIRGLKPAAANGGSSNEGTEPQPGTSL